MRTLLWNNSNLNFKKRPGYVCKKYYIHVDSQVHAMFTFSKQELNINCAIFVQRIRCFAIICTET